MSLKYIGQQLTIYIGISLLTAGIIGNGINIFVFISKHSYRTTSCTFYFLVGSINNIFFILTSLLNRILIIGYQIDLASASIFWCKTRQFLVIVSNSISITCSCLATIDQFLVTSRSQSLRHCSQIKWTYRIVFIVIIIWLCHGIPFLVYYDISPITNSCASLNSSFNLYLPIYLVGIICLTAISIMILFGCLTYRNIQQTIVLINQNVDRQLVKMTLFQVVLVIISFPPYGSYTAYTLITENITKDDDRKMKESLILSILFLMSCLFNTINCYTFLLTSGRFRQTVKKRLFFWKRQNQIVPH